MRPVLGAARRLLERIGDRFGDVPYVPPPVDPSNRLPGALAPALRLLGRFLLRCNLPRRAQRCLSLAVGARPDVAANHLLLGRALLAGGPTGPVRSATLDVVPGSTGDPEAAIRALDRAERLAPRSPTVAVELARAISRAGDADRALAVLARAPATPATKRTRADIVDAVGRARGAHLEVESQELVRLWTDVLAARPDASTRNRLVRHLVAQGDFEEAFHAASPDAPREVHRRWRDVVDDPDLARHVNDDWMYVAAASFLDEGDIGRVRRTKLETAGRIAERPLPAFAPATVVTGRVRAVAYRCGERAAIDELDRRRSPMATRAETLAYDKLDADLHLALGDTDRLVAVRSRLAIVNHEAEHRFRELLHGARVVVVGPTEFGAFTHDELDAFDVVVSTKRPVSTLHGRPTVTYRTDTNARFDLFPALRRGEQHATVEVVRSSMIANGAVVPDHPAIRVMPAEDTNTFLGTRFGIQRILYDLVARGAASIVLTGVNFYLAEQLYVEGYDDEMTRIYAPNQLQPIRSRAPHDHGWDFRFTQRLARHGLIDAHPDVARLLELSLDEYVDRLTEIAVRRPPESMLLR